MLLLSQLFRFSGRLIYAGSWVPYGVPPPHGVRLMGAVDPPVFGVGIWKPQPPSIPRLFPRQLNSTRMDRVYARLFRGRGTTRHSAFITRALGAEVGDRVVAVLRRRGSCWASATAAASARTASARFSGAFRRRNPNPTTERATARRTSYWWLSCSRTSHRQVREPGDRGTLSKSEYSREDGEARVAGLEQYIKRIGLYRTKAKNVVALSKMLLDEHCGAVPQNREALERLPGSAARRRTWC